MVRYSLREKSESERERERERERESSGVLFSFQLNLSEGSLGIFLYKDEAIGSLAEIFKPLCQTT